MLALSAARPLRIPAVRGIAFALLGYAAFSSADAFTKLASRDFAVEQIGLIMALFALIPVLSLTAGQGGLRALVPIKPGLVLLRGLLTSVCMLLVWRAFALLPLVEAYAILFASPMLVTALSALILKEDVGWRRWSAAIVGFAGVLIMIDPRFETLSAAHGLAALAAICGATSFIVLRKIGPSEKSAAILFVLFATVALVSLPGAILHWRTPSLSELGILALAGLLQGSGQAGLVYATREAPAAVVAPFQYTQMIWAVAFGLVLFGDAPSVNHFVGLIVVVASGLYILWRETVRRRQPFTGAVRGEVPARAARALPSRTG